MMDTRQEAYVAGFKAEHRELHGVLHKAEQAWRACEANGCRPADRCELCEAMVDLKDHLVHHFAQEEDGGYLEEALTAAPRLGATADKLLAQHPLLLVHCEELVERLKVAATDPTERRKLHEEFVALRKQLLEHERGENAVMQEAYHVNLDPAAGG